MNQTVSSHHIDRSAAVRAPETFPVRLIAYYLPQYHQTPENDEWWGEGFTDWRNVAKAQPGYLGHAQPRVPADLGYYDLSDVSVIRAQAEMAKTFGINGFCFHHYWFGGRRILEKPLNLLLANPDIDLPFCINWANENWTRTWDGADTSILMAQDYSPEDDIAFARSLEPLFRDPRYIRVNGRPLMMLYRPGILPDAAATIDRWREHFKASGLGDPYFVMPQAFFDHDPRKYGMDAAAGFPPHNGGLGARPMNHRIQPIGGVSPGRVMHYENIISNTLANKGEGFTLLPGVCPNWDNYARRPGRATIIHGSTPESYGDWLFGAAQRALSNPKGEEIVFINAWNEWAESAYLEPDVANGYAYLSETAKVLHDLADPIRSAERHSDLKRILFRAWISNQWARAGNGLRKLRRLIGGQTSSN